MVVPPLLRENPRFRRFWLGQSISLVGDQVSLIALPLTAVLVLDANAAQMGYLAAAELMPNLLFSLHAGAWADRRSRKRHTMIATDLGRALLIGSIPVAYAFDALTFPHMLVVSFLVGTLSVLFHVSYSSLFVALVPRDRFVEGGSIMHGSRALSYMAGPAIGGVLVQALTAPVTLVLDACSYVASAVCLRASTSRAGDRGAREGSRPRRHPLGLRRTDRARRARRHRDDQLLQLRLLRALHPVRDEVARRAPGTLGLVLGAGAIGGVVGLVVTGRVARRIGIGPAFAVGCIVFPAPLLLVPLAQGPTLGCPRLPLPGRVRLGARRDDARHQRRRDLRRGDPRPAALARLRGLHGRELRRPPGGRARRRRARQLDRTARDAVDRDLRRTARVPLPATVADLGLRELPEPEDAGS